ncbi:hypothetical protein Q9K02_02940 [Qipengyuania sp. G39]|uniref:Uncharacterized protein n=1 Tax=Qipengyuania profundimaris TaxID=3067652 RepID=A0ABT9HLU9_9SPHN|nr:hypothetical protein [Qipengyuania sp. G39]MDP4574096.1 hypothetical protein [Qipengyuania sp. G39]
MAKRERRGRRSAARERRSQESSKAWRNIAIVFVLIGTVGFFYIQSVLGNRTLDDETLCPSQIERFTAVLVDVTDPMNTPQRQDFRNQLDRLLGQIERYEKLIIVKVDPVGESLLVPVITRCNPGSGADESEVDGNPKKLEKLHREGFIKPMEEAFDTLMEASSADRSPVMESVQSVALSEFQKAGLEGVEKRLIVASDLLQNTDRVSFYKGLPDAAEFIGTQNFHRVSTDLSGVEVELWMLQRDDSSQTQPIALPTFWERIIGEQGGQVTRVYRVSG